MGDSDQFLNKAKRLVVQTADAELTVDDVYIVWFCKVLGNWKALISTDVFNGAYWEVTYNGANQESYIDTYRKASNDAVADGVN